VTRPPVADPDQQAVAVLLGMVRAAGAQGRRLERCTTDACRDAVGASLATTGARAGEAVRRAQAAGPGSCYAGVLDTLDGVAADMQEGDPAALQGITRSLADAGAHAAACRG
jgi:hypothetical protein